MTQGDNEHLAFENYAREHNLDREMHPLHLLYLDSKTHEALQVFKAGYAAAQQSTAAIQADAVDYAVKVLPKNFIRKDKKEWTIDCDVLKEYAQQLRQQGKEKQ